MNMLNEIAVIVLQNINVSFLCTTVIPVMTGFFN